MGDTRFRVWFGDDAASEDELARIEEIEVTQEMDAFWEAELRMSLCLDARGKWLDWPGDRAKPFSRVRVEIDIGNGDFVPLIDGPLVSVDAALDSQPGRSTATMVVRDDSAYLDRNEEIEPPFERISDSDIAKQVFDSFKEIRDTRIEPKPTTATLETTTWRGTALAFLRELACRNDRHAYVLPGPEPGTSIGCFLPDPAGDPDLPPLLMIGDTRNLADASITEVPDGAERTMAWLLRFGDREPTETSAEDRGLLGDLPAVAADLKPRRLLHPADNTPEDPAAAATAQAWRRSYIYSLSGQVVPGCYGAVLSPYNKVRVDAGAMPHSGVFLITKVVHRITPSLYSQQIEAKSDSLTAVSTAPVAEALGGGLSLALSASVGIF